MVNQRMTNTEATFAFSRISAYGAGGGKGAKNHNKRSNGVFISAIFKLEAGDILYILIGQQGEDACPGVSDNILQNRKSVCFFYTPAVIFVLQRNSLTRSICLGESSVIEDGLDSDGSALEWAGGGGGGGGATYIYRVSAYLFSFFLSGIFPSHICHTFASPLEGTMWTAV